MKKAMLLLAIPLSLSLFSFKNAESPKKPTWYLFHAHWDTWGHKSAGCDGGGLCNFTACAFCEVDDIVSNYSGPVNVDLSTGQGYLTIELDPNDPLQSRWISQQSSFPIDEDIVSKDGTTLYAGVYQFDPNVGQAGGYTVRASVPKN